MTDAAKPETSTLPPISITGLAELAQILPDEGWFVMRVLFRKIGDTGAAEVRIDDNVRRLEGELPQGAIGVGETMGKA